MTDHDDNVRTIAELIQEYKLAFVTTTSAQGTLEARPLVLQDSEFDGDLWFIIDRDSSAAQHVASTPRVGVTFSSDSSWLSLEGAATVVSDDTRLRELWDARLEAWFPEGPDSPNIVLLRIEAEGAEYWAGPDGRIASAISFIKSKVTGEQLDTDNAKVDL